MDTSLNFDYPYNHYYMVPYKVDFNCFASFTSWTSGSQTRVHCSLKDFNANVRGMREESPIFEYCSALCFVSLHHF